MNAATRSTYIAVNYTRDKRNEQADDGVMICWDLSELYKVINKYRVYKIMFAHYKTIENIIIDNHYVKEIRFMSCSDVFINSVISNISHFVRSIIIDDAQIKTQLNEHTKDLSLQSLEISDIEVIKHYPNLEYIYIDGGACVDYHIYDLFYVVSDYLISLLMNLVIISIKRCIIDASILFTLLTDNKSVISLTLDDCEVSEESSVPLLNMLLTNTTLTELDLEESLTGFESNIVKNIGQALLTNTTLKELKLDRCYLFGKEFDILSRSLITNKSLTCIEIDIQRLTDGQIMTFVENTLHKNDTIETLSLSCSYKEYTPTEQVFLICMFSNILSYIQNNNTLMKFYCERGFIYEKELYNQINTILDQRVERYNHQRITLLSLCFEQYELY